MSVLHENAQNAADNFENGDVEDFLNGNVDQDFAPRASDAKPLRIIRKAKRPSRQGPAAKDGGGSGVGHSKKNGNSSSRQPFSKNSRKSRNGKGRGLPKKGGAGGKGTWGQPGEELYEDGICTDIHDPNYDPESQDEYVVEQINPEITAEEFTRFVEPVLLEYYEHGDTGDVKDTLQELNLELHRPKVTELAINIALDHKAMEREMTSVLISDLYGNVLRSRDISNGFDKVLESLADLTLDTPDAPTVVGQFIARAVADDCLPPKYVTSQKGKVECCYAKEALDKASLLLNMKHGIVRLDNVWGTGGGIRPVKFLINQIELLLKEYLSSGDIPEATLCLQEVQVPHFHHELVYEATVMVLEDSSERAAEMMCELLKSLYDAVIITPEQMTQGFLRVYEDMPDICLDVPAAYMFLDRFTSMCYKCGVLSTEVYQELPQRGRKRFVSEGDGGRIKEPIM